MKTSGPDSGGVAAHIGEDFLNKRIVSNLVSEGLAMLCVGPCGEGRTSHSPTELSAL